MGRFSHLSLKLLNEHTAIYSKLFKLCLKDAIQGKKAKVIRLLC